MCLDLIRGLEFLPKFELLLEHFLDCLGELVVDKLVDFFVDASS